MPRCGSQAQSDYNRVSVSDGLLSPRRESNQSAAETPSVSAFPPTQPIISFQMIGTLSRKRAAFAPLARSCFAFRSLCLWFGVPAFYISGLLRTDVCFPLGQRQLLSSLVTDGPRAGRRSVLRWIKRRSSAIFRDGDHADATRELRSKPEVRNQRGFGGLLVTFVPIQKSHAPERGISP